MRKVQFANKEHFHIFNRGVDKRTIVLDADDMERLRQSMIEFNTIKPIGSIYENSFDKKKSLGNLVPKTEKLVNIICFCINPNHYHFILEQCADKGIEKFMHRFGVGYTNFFNKKYKRSGSLFQGSYKAVHISTNEYLLYLSAYVNCNDRVHQLGNLASKSSWDEYVGDKQNDNLCKKDIILNQFKSAKEYEKFAERSLVDILEKKVLQKDLMLE